MEKNSVSVASHSHFESKPLHIAAIMQATRHNFRLLNRLLKQIERIMKVNMVNTITKEIVLAARECLVIGI